MLTTLQVALTRTYRHEPLAVVDGLPGLGAELTPAQLRALAVTLNKVAADCEARPVKGKSLLSVRREYRIDDA